MFTENDPEHVPDRGWLHRFHRRNHRIDFKLSRICADQPVPGSYLFIWNGWKTVRDPDLAGSSIGRICHHHRHGSRILPGDARDEAESAGGDTE